MIFNFRTSVGNEGRLFGFFRQHILINAQYSGSASSVSWSMTGTTPSCDQIQDQNSSKQRIIFIYEYLQLRLCMFGSVIDSSTTPTK